MHLVGGRDGRPGTWRSFRILAGEIVSFEIDVSPANMDFFDFADSADPDGVFRGFGR